MVEQLSENSSQLAMCISQMEEAILRKESEARHSEQSAPDVM